MQRVSDERESGIFCRYFLLKMQKGYLTIYTMYSIVLCKRRCRMDAQLRKGLLEFCVLAAIQKTDSYGYQIIKDISLHIEISESTLYPILRRMEAGGKVESYLVEHQNRIRKYFHLTEAGREYLKGFIKDKEEILQVLAFITGGIEDEEKTIFKEVKS